MINHEIIDTLASTYQSQDDLFYFWGRCLQLSFMKQMTSKINPNPIYDSFRRHIDTDNLYKLIELDRGNWNLVITKEHFSKLLEKLKEYDNEIDIALITDMAVTFISPNTACKFTWNRSGSNDIFVNLTCFSSKLKLISFLNETFPEKQEIGEPSISVIISTSQGLSTAVIGRPGADLIKENYNENVLTKFITSTIEISKDDPFGRILLLHGKPGTGKTHLIKYFMKQQDSANSSFLFLQPEFISRTSSADLLAVLMDEKESNANIKKTYLVIEDGDELIVPRETGDISSLSKLLNMADGMVGALLDLRIIITTNSEFTNIDEALMRPGRLCASILVDKLKPEQANMAFQKISGTIYSNYTKDMTLAEVYADVKRLNIGNDIPGKRNKIGFGN